MENQILELTRLQIELESGVNEKGEPVVKRKTLSNIDKKADAAALKKGADALAGLQKHAVVNVKRLDTWDIE
ncbi:Protein of unknown function [Bacillus sp. OV322]|uniref:DUF1659 domain-containing protein n=1 Tax=Bacillus sp. OV322 TaxID=1882764 RepID=UPI0008EE543A|nr:DUF1659 domain-containing protein [Bacillus sp. OV322]SFC51919.1 Protein of unknown function [Bacillus sp. OV322]